MKPQRHHTLSGSRVAFSENKHKVCLIEYNVLFGVDVGVIMCICKFDLCMCDKYLY